MESFITAIVDFAKRIYRDERGAAITETVIMLPAFIIIWGSIYFVHERSERYLVASAFARHCAWRHATDACPDSDEMDSETESMCQFADGADLQDPWGGTDPTSSAQSSVGFMDNLTSIITGKSITTTREAKVKQPEVLGAKEITYVGQTALSCNERAKGDWFQQMNSDAWGDLAGGM